MSNGFHEDFEDEVEPPELREPHGLLLDEDEEGFDPEPYFDPEYWADLATLDVEEDVEDYDYDVFLDDHYPDDEDFDDEDDETPF